MKQNWLRLLPVNAEGYPAFRISLFIYLFYLSHFINCIAQAPNLNCIQVNSGGDVTLSWTAPDDTCMVFSNYEVKVSASFSGPYSDAGSTTSAILNFTHTGANANSQIKFYYVQTNSGCAGNRSDTLMTILPAVSGNSSGISTITWNPISSPAPPSSSGWYRIYREYPSGNWNLLDSVFKTFSYSDTFTVCTDTAHYKIEINDTNGCFSSSANADLLPDKFKPGEVFIDSVSVNAGFATISWMPGFDTDVEGYIVYMKNINDAWDSIDYVSGSIAYTNSASSPSASIETYSVAAVDSCGNVGQIQTDKPHNTIHLTGSLDVCTKQINLSWNQYINWNAGVSKYDVYVDQGSGFTLLGSTTGISYTHTSLQSGQIYCYMIRAVDGGLVKTSSSNSLCITAKIPAIPAFSYLRLATVKGNDIDLYAFVDTAADIFYYKVMRSSNGVVFDSIGAVSASKAVNISFVDLSAMPDRQDYYYLIDAIDTCRAKVFSSNIAHSVFLNARSTDSVTSFLKWNDYASWSGLGIDYKIYRSIDGIWNSTAIAIIQNGTAEYSDDAMQLMESEGNFCYYIEAIEGTGNIHGFRDTSYSNIMCVTQIPKFVVPNTFSPTGDGINDEFIPVKIFIDRSDYILMIYNKWGQKIFETTNPETGWNGTVAGGRMAPVDAYVYYFNFRIRGGNLIEKTGTVTLLR